VDDAILTLDGEHAAPPLKARVDDLHKALVEYALARRAQESAITRVRAMVPDAGAARDLGTLLGQSVIDDGALLLSECLFAGADAGPDCQVVTHVLACYSGATGRIAELEPCSKELEAATFVDAKRAAAARRVVVGVRAVLSMLAPDLTVSALGTAVKELQEGMSRVRSTQSALDNQEAAAEKVCSAP
jgi:hypothetical protein